MRAKNTGGSPVTNHELAMHWSAKPGVDLVCLSPIFSGDGDPVVSSQYRCAFLKTRHWRSKGFGDLGAMRSFVRSVHRHLDAQPWKPDIVYADDFPGIVNALSSRFPCVLSLHGSSYCPFPTLARNFLSHPYSSLCGMVQNMVLPDALRRCRAIIINSDFSRSRLIKDYPELLAEDRIVVLPRGINFKSVICPLSRDEARALVANKFGLPSDVVLLSFIGGIAGHKGQRRLIGIFPGILAKHPTARLLLPGKHLEDAAACLNLIRELKLEHKVILPGTISEEVRAALYRASDIYVSASVEGFGQNQVEAMSQGLPLVALDVGAVHELFEHGRQGYLAKDMDHFLQLTLQLLQEPETRERMGKLAAEHALQYPWSRMAEGAYRVFERVLGS